MKYGGPVVLCMPDMPDIDNLGVLTISCETIGRQVESDEHTDNSKRYCKCERTIQTEGRKF